MLLTTRCGLGMSCVTPHPIADFLRGGGEKLTRHAADMGVVRVDEVDILNACKILSVLEYLPFLMEAKDYVP